MPGLVGSPLRTTAWMPLAPDVPAPPAAAAGHGMSSSLSVAGPLSRAWALDVVMAAASSTRREHAIAVQLVCSSAWIRSPLVDTIVSQQI